MDDIIIKEFKMFKNSLNGKLKSKVPIITANYYYLIKENWYKEFYKLINSKKDKNNSIKLALKNEQPEFIDDISSILECLNNKVKIKFMSIKILESIYDKKILKDHNQISFCSGNNKIIIEYKDKQDNALFIENPFENISKIMLISTLNKFNFVNNKNQLYNELLSKEQLDFKKIYKKYKEIITNFKDYTDICSSQIAKENILFKKDKKNMDIRYKKEKKKNLNKSLDYGHIDYLMNDEPKKNFPVKTCQNNNNEINKNDEINQLKLKLKDLKNKLEEKRKIIENLQKEKDKYYNKYHEYKIKFKNLESNELKNFDNIIKFNKNKLFIGQNNSFSLLSNKNEENKKKDSENTKNEEIEKLKESNSQNEEIEEMKKKIKKSKKKLEKLKNENQTISEELSKIKIENNKLKEQNEELAKKNEEFENLKRENKEINEELNRIKKKNIELDEQNEEFNLKSTFIKKIPNKKKSSDNRSSSVPKMESQFYNEPIKLYEYPTLIGLNNIGATCFMNSTLQCLSQTEALTNYFLKEENLHRIINNNLAKNNETPQLSPIFLELIKKLWSKEKIISFSPNNFMNTIEKMNPLFKTGQAGDAKDFIIFILEQIHKELKQPICYYYNNFNDIQPLNQYNKNNALNNFINDFKKECSIISDVFFVLMKPQIFALIVEIFLFQMVVIIQYVIIMEYLIA